MNISRSSVKLFISNIGVAAVQFLGITFFARELGASAIGVFFLFQALLGLSALPADCGVRGSLEKRISEGAPGGEMLSSALLLKLVTILPLITIIYLFKDSVNAYLGAGLSIILIIGIILQEVAQTAIVVLRGELRVGETATILMLKQVVWLLVGYLLLIQGFGVEGIVLSLILGFGVMALIGWYKSTIRISMPSINSMLSLFNYGKYHIVTALGGYIYNWMDIAIIGLFLSQKFVGAYEVAWRVTGLVLLLSRSIGTSMFPAVSKWGSENMVPQVEALIEKSIGPSMILVIPSFFGFLILSDDILGIIFGEEYRIASTVLIILTASKIVQSVYIIFDRSLQGLDRPDLAAKSSLLSLSINIVLNIILIPAFGISGAAIATTSSFTINCIAHAYYLSDMIRIRFPIQEVAVSIIASVGMLALLIVLEQFVVMDGVVSLLSMVSVGCISYAMLLALNKTTRERYVRIVYELM